LCCRRADIARADDGYFFPCQNALCFSLLSLFHEKPTPRFEIAADLSTPSQVSLKRKSSCDSNLYNPSAG
jgi:hypothetical protein